MSQVCDIGPQTASAILVSKLMKNYLKRNWKLVLNVVTFGLLALTIFLVRHDIGQALRDLTKINAVALLLVLPLQYQNYVCYGHFYREILAILGSRQPQRLMFKTALEINFVNGVMPSGGVSGFSYFTARLRPHGVSAAQATLAQMMRFGLTFVSFVVLLFAGLFMLALGGSASNMMILITCSLAFLVVFLITSFVFIVSSQPRIHAFTQALTRLINGLIAIFRAGSRETINLGRVEKMFNEMHQNYLLMTRNLTKLARPLLYVFLANVAELATIYAVYIAYGQFVNPGAVIIAYAVANFAGVISVLPGGIGVYEGLMSFVLISAGVPAGLSISVTVMYRVLSMFLGLSVGYVLYRRALGELGSDSAEDLGREFRSPRPRGIRALEAELELASGLLVHPDLDGDKVTEHSEQPNKVPAQATTSSKAKKVQQKVVQALAKPHRRPNLHARRRKVR